MKFTIYYLFINNKVILMNNAKLLFYTKDTNYYSKRNEEKVKLTRKDDIVNLYRDYREFSVVDDIVELLLLSRGIWKRTSNPFKNDFINLAWVGSDTSMVPKKFTNLIIEDKEESVFMKDIYEQGNGEIIDIYVDKISELRNLKPSKELIDKFTKSAMVNRMILARSQVGTRLTKLTRAAGDKTSLYNMIRSYGTLKGRGKVSQNIIPESHEFDFEGDDDLDSFLSHIFEGKDDSTVWVVKPVYGSHGMGMRIDNQKNIRDNFHNWGRESHYFNNKDIVFNKWIFSKFIKSFLWKLDIGKPESLKLCDSVDKNNKKENGLWGKVRVPKLMGDLYDTGEIDTRVTLTDEETGRSFNTFKPTNPSYRVGKNGLETNGSMEFKDFRSLTYKDKLGRINKGRVWVACSIQDGKYTFYVYKKLLFELCSMEFDSSNISHYNEIQRVWTDANSFIYGKKDDVDEELKNRNLTTLYNLDPINAARACDLDLCYMVDWDTGEWSINEKDSGKKFPVDWGKVKENLKNIFEIFFQASKDSVECLSGPVESIDTKGCFQYFGVDFIVDDNANTWLLEFNTRPWSGYGFWWRNYFDNNNYHMPHKYIFVESLLRTFVDTKFNNKPKDVLPLSDYKDINNMWECVLSEGHSNTGRPLVIMSNVLPIKNQNNWVRNRQLKRVFKNRGWSVFPFTGIVKEPDLIMQGMTPHLKWLVSNYNPKTFENEINKFYPNLQHTKIIDRIFPIIGYLGDKAKMVDNLYTMYPEATGSSLPWDEIVPFTLNFDRRDRDMLNLLQKNLTNRDYGFIIKPSRGKQGEGIIISSDIPKIYKHIMEYKKVEEEHSIWSISRYIDKPYLSYNRKTHIRVFVLVSKKGSVIKIYTMKPHLLFMAGLPYDIIKAKDFMNDFFKDSVKNKIVGGNELCLDRFYDFQNLTNLYKGTWMAKHWLKDRSKIKNKNFNKNTIEYKIINTKGDEYNGYELFSDNADTVIDREEGKKGYYKDNIVPQINQIIIQTISSISGEIKCVNRKSDKCFQQLAFDIMLEDTGKDSIPKAWLLEVNTSPGLKAPTKLLSSSGGMMTIYNSIFEHVLSDNPIIEQIFEESKWEGDGVHREYDDVGRKWIDVNHKDGDIKRYRYSAEIGGKMFDENGGELPYVSKKSFRRGEIIYKNTKSKYVTKNNNKRGNIKYDNIFKEIYSISSNQKSKPLVTNKKSMSWLELLNRNLSISNDNSSQANQWIEKILSNQNVFSGFMNGTLNTGIPQNILLAQLVNGHFLKKSKIFGNKYTFISPSNGNSQQLPGSIIGLGVTPYGDMLRQMNGGLFPLFNIPKNYIKNIEKDKYGVCSQYTVEQMKDSLASLGIPKSGNRKEVCEKFAELSMYSGMGLINFEFPFANRTFGCNMDMFENPTSSFLNSMLNDPLIGNILMNDIVIVRGKDGNLKFVHRDEVKNDEIVDANPSASAKKTNNGGDPNGSSTFGSFENFNFGNYYRW